MATAFTAPRMTVRSLRFRFPEQLGGLWNRQRPQFSHIVNAASLGMPYLEPYLIDTMKQARAKLDDPRLLADIDLYIGQEAAHYRQHQQFNKRLADLGYATVPRMEAKLKADYQRFARERSFTFNLAYAEGFEAMALAIGHMLIEDRDYLFKDGEAAVADLPSLWRTPMIGSLEPGGERWRRLGRGILHPSSSARRLPCGRRAVGHRPRLQASWGSCRRCCVAGSAGSVLAR